MTPIQPTRTPRTGRRPGASSTREAILEAARELFAERGYAGATMRAIATEAGVDAALVVHFFGSKAGLLAEAIEWPFDPEVEMPKLVAGGRKNAGGNLVRLFITSWDRDGDRNPILTLLRAAAIEPQAAEMLREFVRERLYPPLLDELGSDQPELRADLAASQLIGVAVARYILKLEPLGSAKPDEIVAWIGPTVQRYLTGKVSRDGRQ